MKSILQSERACYLCGRTVGLELHHIFAGVANRKISTRLGLTCYLCNQCHTGAHGAQYDPVINKRLKAEAQTAFEKTHTRQEWMKFIGKNYL